MNKVGNSVILLLAAALLAGSAGCAWLAKHDRAQVVENARADHENCRGRDYIWPSDAYKECRLDLLNKQEYERWQELDLMRQQQATSPGEIQTAAREPFRPVRWENFYCERRIADDGYDYIYCGER